MSKYVLSELNVWTESRQFRKKISDLVKKLPKDEKFRLSDQLLRASRSISANIAEGHGRFHYQENIQFCRQARGSLVEVFDHLTCTLDEQYISKEEFDELIMAYDNLHRLINGYISYLKKAKLGQ